MFSRARIESIRFSVRNMQRSNVGANHDAQLRIAAVWLTTATNCAKPADNASECLAADFNEFKQMFL